MSRSNNLDALRLLGAGVVIFGHAYHLLGRGAEVPGVLGFPIHSLGVVIFFSISGYLITASWEGSRSLRTYFAARVLRIFPGLILVTLAAILVIGLAATSLSTPSYVHASGTWAYLSNIWMKPNYLLPGVFNNLPYPAAVNGSLWTLPAEFFCYLLVPVALLTRSRVASAVAVAVFLVVSIRLFQVPSPSSAVIWGNRISDDAQMWTFFATGSLIRLAHGRWKGFIRADIAVLLLMTYLLVMGARPADAVQVASIFLPYVILTIGLASTPYIRRAARFGDFSYGLYLWAFPVQQLLIQQFGTLRLGVDLPLVTLISLALAALSWHLVEKPSMGLRHRIGASRSGARRAVVGATR